MALAKISKQLNIANQLITEKVFNGEKSKFNDDYTEMEKKTDATADMVEDLQTKTKEFLQPNPAARAKMVAIKLSSGSQAKAQYPQTEGILGNAMAGHGKKLGEDDPLGQALIETGESLKQIADVKYSLDNNVKQNFLEPLQHLQNNDIKEVLHHRKKLSNRRLDYDGKRRKQLKGGISEDEVRMAQDKFRESLHNASTSMHHLLENDVELISQLAVFSESLMTYYQQCADIMQELTGKLYEKKSEAMNRPKKQFIPTTLSDLNIDSLSIGSNNDRQNNNSNVKPTISNPIPLSQPQPTVNLINNFNNNMRNQQSGAQPHCVALYDFDAENPGELSFKENDTLRLLSRVDDNWYEGMLSNGRTGYIPMSYVQVKVPLP